MIDVHFMRAHTHQFLALLAKKEPSFPGAHLVALDQQVRQLQNEVELLRQERNSRAKQFSTATITPQMRSQARELTQLLKEKELIFEQKEQELADLAARCPNLPFSEVPEGGKEENKVIYTWGEKPSFSFTPQHHVELNEQAGWFDFAAGARMAGARFPVYTGEGALMQQGLALRMVQHNRAQGFSFIIPPAVVNTQSLTIAGQLPKFSDGVYKIAQEDLYLTPTSEVNLTNLYRDHTFDTTQLPIRLTAQSNCFRREAGTYGAQERGLIRMHQFEKVELYTFCTPEQAEAEHQHMLACAQALLQQLGLHYRISLLAAQDASFASAKTYDIEVWMPGQGIYKEVSSSSNCTDFQARACNIKYRDSAGGKSEHVYTLNTSSLALPRVMVALMETYQTAHGTVVLPAHLKQFVWSME